MRAKYKILSSIIIAFTLIAASGDEEEMYSRIMKAAISGNRKNTGSLSSDFIQKYPSSSRIPDVHFIHAGLCEHPDQAMAEYRLILDHFPGYNRRIEVHVNLCEILSLTGRWEDLRQQSLIAVSESINEEQGARFRFYLMESLISTGRFSRAGTEASVITGKSHDYETLSHALLVQSHVAYRTRGMSRDYAILLRELASGFKNSSRYPSVLYLLGEFHESTGDINRAYSAYRDLINLYPRSPESILAGSCAARLKNAGARPAAYIPDDTIISRLDPIDIKPDVTNDDTRSDLRYAVSIGPLASRESARNIRKLAEKIAPCGTVLLKSGYMIYCGRFDNPDDALAGRIRLAEEYGINGSVVRLQSASGRQYIYGE